jgi:hypothetical protein
MLNASRSAESQEHHWLSFREGDLLYTDGTRHSVLWHIGGSLSITADSLFFFSYHSENYIAYRARTEAGHIGCMCTLTAPCHGESSADSHATVIDVFACKLLDG